MLNYVEPDDFAIVADWGINTLLVDLDHNEIDWHRHYKEAIRYQVRLIPLIWGDNQSIWKWNELAQEWELSIERYPDSIGAKFLEFLKVNPPYLEQTFAIYGFHEPLAEEGYVSPAKMKKFYLQIKTEEFPDSKLKVYNEDFSMGWPESDDCLSEITDYDTHIFYPFANNELGRYRPFNVNTQEYDPPNENYSHTLSAEIVALDMRLERWTKASLPDNDTRPQVIVVLQTFAALGEMDNWNLWNRMPTAQEIEYFARYIIQQHGNQIAGVAWYPFERAANNYTHVLKTHRIDEQHADRWLAIRNVCLD